MGGGGRSVCASGQCAHAAYKILSEISKYIDRNFRSTVTVAYIQHIYRENVALKSQVWGSLTLAQLLGECSTLWSERERGTVHGGRIHLLPPEINWAHRMLSQSSASSLLCWSCTHWLKCVASVISDVPLMGSHIEGGELGFN